MMRIDFFVSRVDFFVSPKWFFLHCGGHFFVLRSHFFCVSESTFFGPKSFEVDPKSCGWHLAVTWEPPHSHRNFVATFGSFFVCAWVIFFVSERSLLWCQWSHFLGVRIDHFLESISCHFWHARCCRTFRISGPKEDPFWGTFLVPKVVPEFLTPTGPPPCGSRAGRPATPQAARRRAVRRVPSWLRGSACVAGRAP